MTTRAAILAMSLLMPHFGKADTAPHVDIPKLAQALKAVENSHPNPWQITPAVWHKHSSYPLYVRDLATAAGHAEQERVVLKHLAWLQKHVENPTPFRLALAYHMGATGANTASRVTAKHADYARRAMNIYEEIINKEQNT